MREDNIEEHFNTDLKIAVICSSNQNRSMEAHNFLRYNYHVLRFVTITFNDSVDNWLTSLINLFAK